MFDAIVIVPHGAAWAVKHKDSFLGFAASRTEALMVAQDLAEWIEGQGRPATFIVSETNGAARGEYRSWKAMAPR